MGEGVFIKRGSIPLLGGQDAPQLGYHETNFALALELRITIRMDKWGLHHRRPGAELILVTNDDARLDRLAADRLERADRWYRFINPCPLERCQGALEELQAEEAAWHKEMRKLHWGRPHGRQPPRWQLH